MTVQLEYIPNYDRIMTVLLEYIVIYLAVRTCLKNGRWEHVRYDVFLLVSVATYKNSHIE